MTPGAQSYLSYNWPDKPLGSGHFHKIDKIKVAGAELNY